MAFIVERFFLKDKYGNNPSLCILPINLNPSGKTLENKNFIYL